MFEKVHPLLFNAPWVSQELMDSLTFEPGTYFLLDFHQIFIIKSRNNHSKFPLLIIFK
jgi:hypothetical protein